MFLKKEKIISNYKYLYLFTKITLPSLTLNISYKILYKIKKLFIFIYILNLKYI